MLLNIESLLGGKGSVQKDTVAGINKKIKNINSLISNYLISDKKVLPPKHDRMMTDFTSIKERLSNELNHDQMVKWLDRLPEGVDPDDASMAVSELMPKLKQLIPVNASTTLTGIDEREPSDYEKSKFIRQIRILENPMSILPLIESDAVTGTEVDALKLFYPSLYEVLVASIVDALADLASKQVPGKPATLPLVKNRTISLILGIPRVSPSQMSALQNQQVASDQADISSPAGELTEPQRIANT